MLNHPLPATPALIAPSAVAMSLWAKAHDRLEAERHAEPDDRLRAARSKLIGLIPRLSLVFQVVSAASGEGNATVKVIDETSMQRAITIAQWATRETKRVYAMLAVEAKGGDESAVIRLIESRGGQITARGLMHASRQFRSSASAAEAYLNSMVKDGLGRWEWRTTGGRPSHVFVLNGPISGNTSPLPEGINSNSSPALNSASGAFVTVTSVTTN
jgi:hypothetical protein